MFHAAYEVFVFERLAAVKSEIHLFVLINN